MRPVDVIPGPGDPNMQPEHKPSEPQPAVPAQPEHAPEVPTEPKHYPIHREIPTQPIHEGGVK